MTIRKRTDYVILHCSATEHDKDLGVRDIDAMHREKGWSGCGYHYVIKLDGTVEAGRSLSAVGAHCRGYNNCSVGVCFIGGLVNGVATNTLTEAQIRSGRNLVLSLMETYPDATVRTHRSFSPDMNGDGKITSNEWMKQCPCFEVEDLMGGEVDINTMIDL